MCCKVRYRHTGDTNVIEESMAYELYELEAIRRYFQEHLKP